MKKVIITITNGVVQVARYDDKGEYDASMYELADFGSWLFLQFIWSWLIPTR